MHGGLEICILLTFIDVTHGASVVVPECMGRLCLGAPQGNPFCNHGGYQYKCDGLTPVGSKRSGIE